MRVFMAILCSLLAVCSVSARDRRHEETDRQATIYRLPPLRERCDARNILRVGTLKNITRIIQRQTLSKDSLLYSHNDLNDRLSCDNHL